jgi:hypothetical protein
MPIIPGDGITYDVSVKNELIDFSDEGDWDFSETTTDSDSTIEIVPISDYQGGGDYTNATHVKFEDGFAFFLGYEPTEYTYNGEQSIITSIYPTPLVVHPYPFNIGDYHTDGVYNIPFTCYGCPSELYRDDEVETASLSSGSVKMPDGAIYDNVTLIQTTRTFTDGQSGSSPCITTLQAWHWWAEGYAIPIIETRTMESSGPCPQNPTQYTKFLKTESLGNQDNELSNAIELYPSPAKKQVTLSNSSNILLKTAMIYDLKGKLVSQINLQNMQSERVIDVSSFATGVYMVHIKGEQSSVLKRMIKE